MTVRIRDVTLRDGLQSQTPVATAVKVRILDALVAAGVRDLEVASFVHPAKVPSMADAEQLVEAGRNHEAQGVSCWSLVVNLRGAQRALAVSAPRLQYVISVSDRHNRENTGRSVTESLRELAAVTQTASANGTIVEVTLATAFGCPFVGPIPPQAVLDLTASVVALDVAGVTLADTVGTAIPTEVQHLVSSCRKLVADKELGLHLHDTRGLALANALAGVDAGADRLDGALGSLGGCPFAPGATGNLALEDLVHCLEAMGQDTGIALDPLLEVAALACASVGRPVASHVGIAGPRFAQHPSRRTASRTASGVRR